MKKEIIKLVRREVRRALTPTGLIGRRGPAKSIHALVSKSTKAGFKEMSRAAARSGREISVVLGLSE